MPTPPTHVREWPPPDNVSALVILTSDVLVGPAPYTQRYVYTVPTGRWGRVVSANAAAARSTVAGAIGLTVCPIFLATGAGSAPMVQAMFRDVNPGAKDSQTFSGQPWLKPGEILQGYTFDGSTGGIVEFYSNVHVREYIEQ